MPIKDSGNRRKFESGAVRDIQEGKGRCDLMPLGVIAKILGDSIIALIDDFMQSDDVLLLYQVIRHFMEQVYPDKATALLELSIHFEEGAKKYGDNNWQKGIPISCYIDSAVRHYLKYCRGDNDERHDRAFMWNIVCCIWETSKRHMEEIDV